MRTTAPACGYGLRHVKYRMTCEEFLDLLARAAGRCEICKEPRGVPQLHIDHDHAVGQGAVRGLLCSPCNTRLVPVDQGRRSPTPEQARYLAHPWHVTGSKWLERRVANGAIRRRNREVHPWKP